MKVLEKRIKELVSDVVRLDNYSTGQLAMEMAGRLPIGTQIRVTAKGVRVTHSHYIDKLKSAMDVDAALQQNVHFAY